MRQKRITGLDLLDEDDDAQADADSDDEDHTMSLSDMLSRGVSDSITQDDRAAAVRAELDADDEEGDDADFSDEDDEARHRQLLAAVGNLDRKKVAREGEHRACRGFPSEHGETCF